MIYVSIAGNVVTLALYQPRVKSWLTIPSHVNSWKKILSCAVFLQTASGNAAFAKA